MTDPQEQENYLRMLFLVLDVGASAKRGIVAKQLTNNGLNSFEDFIDKNQHEIYHYFDNKKCCQCKSYTQLTQQCLVRNQLELIFDVNRNRRRNGHHYGKNNRYCCLKAANISLQELDFTLLGFFIINFCDDLIWDDCLHSYSNDFETFLNREKHNIFHMWKSNTACCLCRIGYIPPKQCIQSDQQFLQMFTFTKNNCNDDTCGYSVMPGLTYEKLKNDDKLLFINLTNAFCPLRKAIEIITAERNNLAHSSQLRMDQASFKRSWKKVSAAIKRIASATDTLIDMREKIKHIKNQHFDVRLCLHKLEDMLRENRDMQDISEIIENLIGDMKETEKRISQLERKVEENTAATEKVYALLERLFIEGNVSNRDQLETTQDRPATVTERVASAIWTSSANVIGWCISTVRRILYNNTDDNDKDSFKCGPCQSEFEKIQDFCAHKYVCTKRKKIKKCTSDSFEKYAAKDKYLQVSVQGIGEKWEKQTVEYIKQNKTELNVNGAEVVSGELGSVIFWIKLSAATLASSSLASLMNSFLRNLFSTCPVEENKTIPFDVNIDMYEEISDEDEEGDIYRCGLCNYECSLFTSFVRHKTEKCQTKRENSDLVATKDFVPGLLQSKGQEGIKDTRFKQKCGKCSNETSVYWCHGCRQSLCQDCYNKHGKSTYHIFQHVDDMFSLDYTIRVYNVKEIRDIKVLPDGMVVIADRYLSQLITCYASEQQHLIPCFGIPERIAVVDNNTVAVITSLIVGYAVVIVDVRKRTVEKTIDVKENCVGIMCKDNQLFLGCYNRILVLNMSGEIVRTISVRKTPHYICGSEAGYIYYTDSRQLYCTDRVGSISRILPDPNIIGPIGITTDDEGHVLVLNYVSNSVLRISPDGKQSQIIIRQIRKPDNSQALICYNSLSKSVGIAHYHSVYFYKKI